MATLPRAIESDPYDVSRAELFRDDTWRGPFAALRRDDPIHYTPDSAFGPYWSITTYKPIVHIESLPDIFSSEANGITISELIDDNAKRMPMFIARDRPVHTAQRRTVAPAFAPSEMSRMTGDIRARTAEILDGLPWDEPFDWVDRVSIELTTQMLAILFDFPWEDRRKLTNWSDWAGDIELARDPARREQRMAVLHECGDYFARLWAEKLDRPAAPDLISMMIRSDAMSHMDRQEFLGNLILLIVGGNDTTRNTMSGLAFALDRFPDERAKLEADPALIPKAVSEIVRWQTPLAHMRRTATRDYELDGRRFRAGDKVILWYLSANRDESMFDDGEAFRINRANARRHLAFGHGIHRCVGARLAELQVTVLLEEMARRRMRVEVLGEPERVAQCFVHGYRRMMVRIGKY